MDCCTGEGMGEGMGVGVGGMKKGSPSNKLLGKWSGIFLKVYLLVSSAQICEAVSCPETILGMKIHGPSPEYKCYATPGSERSFWDSSRFCDPYGMVVPIINSAAENNLVKSLLRGDSWIGLYDHHTEGRFIWQWGMTTPLWTNWNSGEPNNSGNEDCVEMRSNGKWNDKACSTKRYTICAICASGAYFSSGNCAQCPAGKFTSSPNKATSCDDCGAGTYSSAIGQTSCSLCRVGTSSSPGSQSCTDCLPGQYNDVAGGICRSCPAGHYSKSDRSGCLPCPAGEFAKSGDPKCLPCAPGHYSTGASESCLPCGFPISHWAGGSSCRCVPPWSGSNCDVEFCPESLDSLSLGSLLLQSIRSFKNFTSHFTPDALDTHATVRGILKELFSVTVDADGDEIITHDEMTATLRSFGVYGSNFMNLRVWCPANGACVDDYDRNQLIEETYSNYLNSAFHEFDGTGLDLISSFNATFPLTSWTDQECEDTSNQPVNVNWAFRISAPSFYRVCGYSNGVLLDAFNRENTGAIDGTLTTFDDSISISADFGFRRVYCLRIEYCATLPRSQKCTQAAYPNLYNAKVICTMGIRYDGAPLDLSASLSETGVSFRYMDTSVGEHRVSEMLQSRLFFFLPLSLLFPSLVRHLL